MGKTLRDIFRRGPGAMPTYDVQTQGPADVYSKRPDIWNAYFPTNVAAKFVSLKTNQPLPFSGIMVFGPGDNPTGMKNARQSRTTPVVNENVYLRHASGTVPIQGGAVQAQAMADLANAQRPIKGLGPGSIVMAPPYGGGVFGKID